MGLGNTLSKRKRLFLTYYIYEVIFGYYQAAEWVGGHAAFVSINESDKAMLRKALGPHYKKVQIANNWHD
jgi:hypothetical protein